MWDFEHPPLSDELAKRYRIDRMTPAECAEKLATGQADIGLIPIAALATSPELRILPGCTIASKGRVRSLLLVHRAWQPLTDLQSVAADTASRTTIAYAHILFHKWGNPGIQFLPMAADLDLMLASADAAILIGDPALLALEERFNRMERTGEELVYRDLAAEWNVLTGLPFVSAVWSAALHAAALWMRVLHEGLYPLTGPWAGQHRRPGGRVGETDSHSRGDHPRVPDDQHPLRARRGVRGGDAGVLPHGGRMRGFAAVHVTVEELASR